MTTDPRPRIGEFADDNTRNQIVEWVRTLPVPEDFAPDPDRAMLQDYWVLHGDGGAWRKLVWAEGEGAYSLTLLGTTVVNRGRAQEFRHLIAQGAPRSNLETAGVFRDLRWPFERYPGGIALSEEEKAALLAHPEGRAVLRDYGEARGRADAAEGKWDGWRSGGQGLWIGVAVLLWVPGLFLLLWLLFSLGLPLEWGLLWIVAAAVVGGLGEDLFGLPARIQRNPRRFLDHRERDIAQMARHRLWKQGEAVPEGPVADGTVADPDTYVRHSLTEYSEALRQDAAEAEDPEQREYIEAVLHRVEAERVARGPRQPEKDPTRKAREAEAYLRQLRR